MKTSIISSLLILGLGANLYALNVPESAKADKRMTFAQYDANDVFLINAKNGYVSMVKFADDERIVNIATGFSDGWDLVDKENFLFIKPKSYVAQPTEQQQAYDEDGNQIQYDQSLVIQPNEEDWKTNLIVTTNKRIYVFDLSLQSSKKTNYRVEFLYPLDLQAAAASEQLAKERAKAEEEIEKDNNMVKIPILSDVSAGYGEEALEEATHWIKLPTSIARNAAFGTFVAGDSMEPKINDGDLLLVQGTPQLDSGEIGVFLLNEKVYCKRFHYNPITKEIVLKSLNTNYKPMYINKDDDFRIVGKVVGIYDYTV